MPNYGSLKEQNPYWDDTVLSVGPVVGAYQGETLRILVETYQDTKLKLTITLDGSSSSADHFLDCIAKRACVFTVKLTCSGLYTYTINMAERRIFSGSFIIPDLDAPFRFATVSCNAVHEIAPNQSDPWTSLLSSHYSTDGTFGLDFLLHIGDQIYEYRDNVWERSHVLLSAARSSKSPLKGKYIEDLEREYKKDKLAISKNKDYTVSDVEELVKELYRNLYRKTWRHHSQRMVMTMVQNHMILDDHDIRNGWGILEADRNPSSIEYRLGQCAYQIYREYQGQLWRELDNLHTVDYRTITRGSSTLFIMDLRNPRTFCYNQMMPYVGLSQMAALSQLLSQNSTKKLALVTSVPLLMMPETITELTEYVDFSYDVRDQWTSTANQNDHKKVLALLSKWKRTDPERSLLLIGGDIHFGMRSSLSTKEGCNIGVQWVTSPMTNVPTTGLVGTLQDFFARQHYLLYGKYNVEHHERVHKRNFLLTQETTEHWTCQLTQID